MWTTHHRKTKFVCVEYHKLDRNYTRMEDGSSMGLSFTIPNMYATTCKHTIYVYMRHGISYTIHDIYNTHHMTYNTWYLYAHRSPHLLRTCRFTINTVQYLYLFVYICISLHMCTTFWYDVIQCNTMSYIIFVVMYYVAHVTWGFISWLIAHILHNTTSYKPHYSVITI